MCFSTHTAPLPPLLPAASLCKRQGVILTIGDQTRDEMKYDWKGRLTLFARSLAVSSFSLSISDLSADSFSCRSWIFCNKMVILDLLFPHSFHIGP